MEKRKDYQTLDFIRIVASFFVVLVHVHLPVPHAYYTMAWARFAVPLFYMINGYFLFEGADTKEARSSKIRKSLIKIGRMTLFTIVYYIISNSAVSLINGQTPFYWFTSVFSPKILTELILFNHTDFFCHIVWYLLAYLYVLTILYLLAKYDLIRRIWFLIPFLITINILLGEVVRLEWFYQGNWLLTALPFILIGIYINQNPDFLRNLSLPVIWVLVLGGSLITFFESLFHPGQVLYLGSIPTALGLFILGIRSKLVWHPKISAVGRKLTIYIFILHCSIRDIYYSVFGKPGWPLVYFFPLVIFILSAMGGYLAFQLNKKIQSTRNKTSG